MSEVLVVGPKNYGELREELDEIGVGYDVAKGEEAPKLISNNDYDVVVGPNEQDTYLRTMPEELPFLVYNDNLGDLSISDARLTGNERFDARRINSYLCDEDTNFERDLHSVVESYQGLELFLDLFQHDVKNDLQLAQAYLDMMELDDTQKERAEIVDDRLNSIDDLVETVSKVKRIEESELEEMYIPSVFQSLEESCGNLIEENDFDVKFNYESGVEVLAGPLIEDMYCQLVENSLNHSGGTEVRINAENSEKPVVTVEDDGEGIPENIKDNLFEKGVKGEKTGDTGIGTALVDRIAERYNIDIEVGESDMGGAEFRLEHQPAEN